MCVLPAYMSCIRWSLMPPPKNLGSFPRASQHMSCVAVSVHVFLPFSRLAAIFSNRPQQTAGVSGSRARRTRRKKKEATGRPHLGAERHLLRGWRNTVELVLFKISNSMKPYRVTTLSINSTLDLR